MPAPYIQMNRETGLWGCRTTVQAACQIGLRVWAWAVGLRDSWSQRQANATLMTQSPAAIRPGAAWLQWVAEDPTTGPSMTPSELEAESQPRARARSAGRMVS